MAFASFTRHFGRTSAVAQSRLRRAVVETLDQRKLLSITPTISGANSVTEGSNYTLALAFTGNTPQTSQRGHHQSRSARLRLIGAGRGRFSIRKDSRTTAGVR